MSGIGVGARRLLCTRVPIVSIAATPHMRFHMCQMIRFALTRDHEPRHIRRAARPLVAPAGLALCARATRRLRRGRISPLETARCHIGLKIGGIILDFSPISCSCQSSPCDSEPFRPSVASAAPRHESRTPLATAAAARFARGIFRGTRMFTKSSVAMSYYQGCGFFVSFRVGL